MKEPQYNSLEDEEHDLNVVLKEIGTRKKRNEKCSSIYN